MRWKQTINNEQNLEIFQGDLQLEFLVELLEVQTPSLTRRAYSPRGHPQTPGNGGDADQETGLPREEDTAGADDSQEKWHEK